MVRQNKRSPSGGNRIGPQTTQPGRNAVGTITLPERAADAKAGGKAAL